ncbi:tail fiber domain-containing protein [uncultured Lacinutrix sp.]|uniref:tail fiber domain-containing protein n=1 Tax=uncultured Lacinutrix sp. TaxID=574032 RepID=UPI00260A6322|nr:tail fiber domain-containing protein [uncultured Lacinutrix sp.]
MKKLTLIGIITIALNCFGQAPESFNYQAVVRDAGNTILSNQSVGMQMTIRQGSAGGTAVYSETFASTTNAFGLVNLEIGTGTSTDDFSTIDWATGPYFIETAIDVTGGTLYSVVGANQLISVPYALYAKNAEMVDDADADPTNEIQDISLSGTDLTISDGSTVDLSNITDDGDWVVTSGTNYTNANEGNIGIGNMALTQNRWKLTVKDTVNCMLDSKTIDVSKLFAVFTRNLNENNTGVGIGFQSTSTVTGMGAAIVHERTSSNSRGKLHFATKSSGSAADEDLPIRMTIDEVGRLGVGVTSPTEYLHVSGGNGLFDRGSSTSSVGRSLTLGGARNGDATFGSLDFQNYDSDSAADYVGASLRSNNGGDATENGNLRFLTYNGTLTERMRIDENGLVGIGETAPQARLDVSDIAVVGNLSVGSQSTDQGTSGANGLGYTTTPWLYTNAIEAQGERGSASTLITLGADGTYGAADQIHMVTSGNSQMMIASDGKVGFDKTTPDTDLHIRQSQTSITNGTGGIKFEEAGDATDYWRVYHSGIFFSFNLQGNRVAYVNTTGAWTVDSDRRLKYDIKPLQPVLDRVMQLKPVDYLYNEQKSTENKVIGFVAQEVKPLFPEIVVDSEEDKLGITYGATGVIAIKAIQEQQKTIEEQKVKIEEMELLLQQLIIEVNELKKKK